MKKWKIKEKEGFTPEDLARIDNPLNEGDLHYLNNIEKYDR